VPSARAILRRSAQAGTALAERTGLLGLLERAAGSTPGRVHVLTYHRVAERADWPDLYPGLVSDAPAAFAEQMEYLARSGRAVSMEQVLAAARGDAELPPGAVTVTFDDAYQDFAECAWPVLERLGLPVTLFVPTDYADRPAPGFWWDRLYHAVNEAEPERLAEALDASKPSDRLALVRRSRDRIKNLPHEQALEFVTDLCARLGVEQSRCAVLDWEQLRGLAKQGVTLCPHTRAHPLLNRVDEDRIVEEVAGSFADLRREVGEPLPVFAWPSGAWSPAAVRKLEAQGLELSFTTRRGVADLRRHHRQLLPRIPVVQKLTFPAWRAQLLPQFAHLNRLWGSGDHDVA
jgi:peptidoglycan/xylan/chitin deacetylase (PgdA/CDA1 family)